MPLVARRHTAHGITSPRGYACPVLDRGTPVLSWPAWYPCPGVPSSLDWSTPWLGLGYPIERTWDQRLGRDLGPETVVPPPPVLTDTCKNITLYAGGKNDPDNAFKEA